MNSHNDDNWWYCEKVHRSAAKARFSASLAWEYQAYILLVSSARAYINWKSLYFCSSNAFHNSLLLSNTQFKVLYGKKNIINITEVAQSVCNTASITFTVNIYIGA